MMHILHIEDQQDDADLFTLALKRCPLQAEVTLMPDGETAWEFLSGQGRFPQPRSPDLILLDLNLPKKNGRELLAEIKRDEALKLTPVIILTTSKSPSDVLHSYQMGAACYLVKPLDFDTFSLLVRRLVEFWSEVVTVIRPRI